MQSSKRTTRPGVGLADRAKDAERRPPGGTSAREGVLVMAMAALAFVLLSVTFQARSWGGIVGAGMTLVFLMLLPVLAGARSRNERVHPRGWTRHLIMAGVWGVVVAFAGGFLWRSGLVEVAAPIWLTTLVALAAAAPMACLGLRLTRTKR